MRAIKKSTKRVGLKNKLGRIPLPGKSGHPHTVKKDKGGYNRKRVKRKLEREDSQGRRFSASPAGLKPPRPTTAETVH